MKLPSFLSDNLMIKQYILYKLKDNISIPKTEKMKLKVMFLNLFS